MKCSTEDIIFTWINNFNFVVVLHVFIFTFSGYIFMTNQTFSDQYFFLHQKLSSFEMPSTPEYDPSPPPHRGFI